MGWCEFCQTVHSSASCYHPANATHSERGPYGDATRIAALEAENTALKGVQSAARRLADRLSIVHNHPAYVGVWMIAQAHGGPYTGPQYTDELAALKKALVAALEAGK
jgi:hypothetical protein